MKNKKNIKMFLSTLLILALIYFGSLLVSIYIIPTIRIYDESMNPTLNKDDIFIFKRTKNINRGDFVAFYVDDKLLIKRCIATGNDTINIDLEGNIYINDSLIEEKYIINKSYGKVSIDLPYQIEENNIFVLSDDRTDPSDSRNSLIGSIPNDKILGKIVFRIYPIKDIGKIN